MDKNHKTDLLFTDLGITAASAFPLKALDASLEIPTERTGVIHKGIELLCIPLGGGIVHVVEGPGMEIADPRYIVVEGPQCVLQS